jgi:hypothetical protein
MIAASLVGSWSLVSWEVVTGDGERSYPYGRNPGGLLVYTEDGHMSVAIMSANRPRLRIGLKELMRLRRALFSRPWTLVRAWRKLGGLLRYLTATANYLSYCGSYDIAGDSVTHHVSIAIIPDWIGTDLQRAVELTDGRLLLRASAGETQQRLVWERA